MDIKVSRERGKAWGKGRPEGIIADEGLDGGLMSREMEEDREVG